MNSPKSSKRRSSSENKNDERVKSKPLRYGPLPKLSNHHIWSRGVIILGVVIYMWYNAKTGKEISLAKQKDFIEIRAQTFDCDPKYLNEIKKYPGCVPSKCGRYVTDKLVTAAEADSLLKLAKRALGIAGSSGGASILDLHSGALSYEEKFINIYTLKASNGLITPADLNFYKIVKNKIQHAIAENFGIDGDDLFLTHPTFFSKLSNGDAKTLHDEYWHIHIDKETYESFHYTSLLYLTDFDIDFKGGRFVFVDNIEAPHKNTTIDPRKGRVLMFTSGGENPHFVEKVTTGIRYAITVSFTCDATKAISDPSPT